MVKVIPRSLGALLLFDNGGLETETEWNLGLGGEYSVYTGYIRQLSS